MFFKFTPAHETICPITNRNADLDEAILVEKSRLNVVFKNIADRMVPKELQQRLESMPVLQSAIESPIHGVNAPTGCTSLYPT